MAVDNLTAAKARITFARVCVQINTLSPFPDTIPINLNEKKFEQEIVYNWKPSVCSLCNTFSHDRRSCPQNPPPQPNLRRRSRSRVPQSVNSRATHQQSGNLQGDMIILNVDQSTQPQDIPSEELLRPPSPSNKLTDLNQSPTLSRSQEDSLGMEEDSLLSKDQSPHNNPDHSGDINIVGVITRSAAISPTSLKQLQNLGQIPKSPSKVVQEECNSSKAIHKPTPTPQKRNKKKGKKPSTSSSQ